jgi:putative peptidoglycan lipid II flippase
LEQSPDSVHKSENGTMSAAGTISVAIMISRVLGLIREMVLAKWFGAGLQTDAFNIAFRIPNLLRDLFAEGVLSSAFVPTFVKSLTQDGKQQAWLLTNRVISALLVILGALTLILFFGAKLFVYLLAASYAGNPGKFELTVQMTRIMSPFLLCVSLAAVGMGILNACGSFFIPALASSAFNVCCILAGIFLSPLMPQLGLDPIVSMAAGTLIGGATQFIVMIPSVRRFGFHFRFDLNLSDPGLRRIATLMLPAIIGLSATQINITVDSQLASMYGDGPVSYLSYGFRLMQLPIGIFGIAIATVTLVSVSHLVLLNDTSRLLQTMRSSLRIAACMSFPAMIGLIIFRQEIVRLLYERGSFTPIDTLKTSQVVLLYAFQLFSYSTVRILVPAFYALNDTKTPVRTSIITVLIKILLNFVIIFTLPIGFAGLVLATTIASWINCGMLIKKLSRKIGVFCNKDDYQYYLRILIASCAMGLIAWIVFRLAMLISPGPGILSQVFRLGMAIPAGIAAIFPLFRIFKVKEGNDILQRIKIMIGNAL